MRIKNYFPKNINWINLHTMKRLIFIMIILSSNIFAGEIDTTLNIRPLRLGLCTAFSVGGVAFASSEFTKAWGESSSSKWGWKTGDYNGDGLLQTDEIGHFQLGQLLTEFGYGMATWSGLNHKTGLWIGGGLSFGVLLWVEIIDAYNPSQGFGVTDIFADLAGILFAVMKKNSKFADRFDLRVTFEDLKVVPNNLLLPTTFAEYDNYIFWLTYQPHEDIPVDICLGYSTDRDFPNKIPRRELYIGAGISGEELITFFGGKKTEKLAAFARWYEITIYTRVYRGPEIHQDEPH